MRNMIYADNAATTQLDGVVVDEMLHVLKELYANPSQPYSFSKKEKNILKQSRETISSCINANPNEIFFTSGGTESNNWVIKSFGNKGKEKVIITTKIEHHSILNACDNSNAKVYYLDVDNNGFISLTDLESLLLKIRKQQFNFDLLVSVMLANNEIGTIQDIKNIVRIAKKYNALVHTDAVQAVGHINIDVKDIGVDYLSSSAHKFNGPKGVGFLYIKNNSPIIPLINGGSQEKSMRSGTENVAGIFGMAEALKNNIDTLDQNTIFLQECVSSFFEKLDKSDVDYILNGPDERIPGNINISIKGKDGEALMHLMDLKGVMISTGSACDSVNSQLSHVIKAINCPEEYSNGTIRISFGKYNTKEEASLVAEKLIEICKL